MINKGLKLLNAASQRVAFMQIRDLKTLLNAVQMFDFSPRPARAPSLTPPCDWLARADYANEPRVYSKSAS